MAESPRPLTPDERGVLDFILAQEWQGVDQVRTMLRNTRASLGCDCGCGSLDLTVEPLEEPLSVRWPVPAEAWAFVEGQPFHALLFVDEDGGELEFVWYGDPASRLPRPDELSPSTAGG